MSEGWIEYVDGMELPDLIEYDRRIGNLDVRGATFTSIPHAPIAGLLRFRELIPLHEAEEAIREVILDAFNAGGGCEPAYLDDDEWITKWRGRRKGA